MITVQLIPMATGAEVAFWMMAPVMVLGALGTILCRRAVHSALCLAALMIALAVQYAALAAPFLFVVQIIVYTGAILMLFLFVLMLVGVDSSDSLVETIRGQRVWAIIGGIGFGLLLLFAVGNAVMAPPQGLDAANSAHGGNVQGIAALLFTRYVFAFEATAALLITAALGAMVLAHLERLKPKKTQFELVNERMRKYADTGQHPGPLPSPGVFARHNAMDTPALLPDGTASDLSVPATLRAHGTVADADELSAPIRRTLSELSGAPEPGDEGQPPRAGGGNDQ